MLSDHLGEVVKEALQLVQTGHQPSLASSRFNQLLLRQGEQLVEVDQRVVRELLFVSASILVLQLSIERGYISSWKCAKETVHKENSYLKKSNQFQHFHTVEIRTNDGELFCQCFSCFHVENEIQQSGMFNLVIPVAVTR